MIKYGLTLTACAGALCATLLPGDAHAFTHEECLRLSANQYLAAIERGVCDVNIETAAGPQQDAAADAGDGNRDGRGEGGNGGRSEGGDKSGGGNPGGGGGRGNPNKP